MKLNKEDFYFDLPSELIAQSPLEKREQSRMLCFDGQISHRYFFEIENLLHAGDVLVLNEARVAPVRLLGKKENINGANCEVLLLRQIDAKTWHALVKPGKRLKTGVKIIFGNDFWCEVAETTDFGGREIKFSFEGNFFENLDRYGCVPLPQYIKSNTPADIKRYNTVYAKTFGSSAAPTAGLHFTEEILSRLQAKGVVIKKVLLNVGLGTFRPVKTSNIMEHTMHSESFEVPTDTANEINAAKKEGRRIVAVGTTVVRTLEAVAAQNGDKKITAFSGDTNIFIHNNFDFKIVDAIITNFHLPESTLVMLVAAFIGYENWQMLYKEAIKEQYRFYSFGDCCFLVRNHKRKKDE